MGMMKSMACFPFLFLAVMLLGVGQAHAGLLTFDDVTSIQNSYGIMPTIAPGYKGFIFAPETLPESGNDQLLWIDVVGSSDNYGAISGNFALYNHFGGTGGIREQNGSDFTFDGLWAKKWGTDPESGGIDSLSGTLSGWNNGIKLWSVDTSLNESYEHYGAQVDAIDELRLGLGSKFLVDDLTLNVVPTPGAFLLGCLGLGAAGMRLRKRKTA